MNAPLTVDPDVLRSPEVGLKVIRGGTVRGAGYAVGMVLTAAASVLLLRYLGVVDFGRFVTIASLMAIVDGVTNAGLMLVAGRDLSLLPPGEQRRRLLANVLGVRLVLTPIGVLGAVLFCLAAGYDRTLVLGTLIAGAGVVLITAQSTLTLPLAVDLKIGRLTTLEVLKQAVMAAGVAALVAGGASLLSFFALYVAVGLVLLAVTPVLVGRALVVRPAFHRDEWRPLIREALPLAAALVMNVVYFRVLIILMSLLAAGFATGLFATSFRVFEILFGVPSLLLSVALPVLAVAAEERSRLRYMLQRMTEVSLLAAVYLVLLVVIVAEPLLVLLGGKEYGPAAPVLQILVFTLIPVFLGQVLQLGLISVRRQSALVIANGVALGAVLAFGLGLIPFYGAKGAAVAAVVAESLLALSLLVLLVRFDRLLCPSFGFVWKVAVAGLLGASSMLIPGLPVLARALIATGLYSSVLLATQALPPEIATAFRARKAAR